VCVCVCVLCSVLQVSVLCSVLQVCVVLYCRYEGRDDEVSAA
jgi:hypothetical protein